MSVGATGYDDWQVQSAWDGTGTVYELEGPQTGPVVSGVFDCSRFASIYAWLSAAGNPFYFQADWYADKAATRKVGNRYLTLDPNVRDVSRFGMGGFGPWVVFSCNPATAGTQYTPNVRAILTNRDIPKPLSVVGEEITNSYGNIAAGATIQNWPVGMWAGNCSVNIYGGDQGINCVFNAESNTFVMSQFYQVNVAALQWSYQVVNFPAAPVRIDITNPSGANPCVGSSVRMFPQYSAT